MKYEKAKMMNKKGMREEFLINKNPHKPVLKSALADLTFAHRQTETRLDGS